MERSSRIAVVGAGAVGGYFGGLLARAGMPVTLIGRPVQVNAIERDGLKLDTLTGEIVVRVTATSTISAAGGARIVLIAVKTPDTETTAVALAPHLAKDAIVVSLQNGVNNAERMYRAAGVPALAAAVYVAVRVAAPGQVTHTGRGDLVLGDPLAEAGVLPRRTNELALVEQCFTRAGVPCKVATDVREELWTKLVMNCVYNAISALTGERYGAIAEDESRRGILEAILDETIAIAARAGIVLDRATLLDAALRLGREAMPNALSSTAQDLLAGKRTEIDSLNGYVGELGKRYGIPTPVNDTLHALVKLAERSRAASAGTAS